MIDFIAPFLCCRQRNRAAITLFSKALPLEILHSQNQKSDPAHHFLPHQIIAELTAISKPPRMLLLSWPVTQPIAAQRFLQSKNQGIGAGENPVGEALLKQMLQLLVELAI